MMFDNNNKSNKYKIEYSDFAQGGHIYTHTHTHTHTHTQTHTHTHAHTLSSAQWALMKRPAQFARASSSTTFPREWMIQTVFSERNRV